jgi:hypothetical protein
MARTTDRSELPGWLLAAIPAVALLAVVFVWVAIDTVGAIGPLDKAKLGWLVAVPLTFALPVLTAWAGGQLGRWGRPVLAALVGLAAGLAIAWPIWVSYSGLCAAVGRPVPIVSIATTGMIVGLTLFGAVVASGAALDLNRPRRTASALAFVSAAVVCAIGFAVFVLFSIMLFFGQCAVRPQITP